MIDNRIFIITNEDDYAPYVPELEAPEDKDAPGTQAEGIEKPGPDGPDEESTLDEGSQDPFK